MLTARQQARAADLSIPRNTGSAIQRAVQDQLSDNGAKIIIECEFKFTLDFKYSITAGSLWIALEKELDKLERTVSYSKNENNRTLNRLKTLNKRIFKDKPYRLTHQLNSQFCHAQTGLVSKTLTSCNDETLSVITNFMRLLYMKFLMPTTSYCPMSTIVTFNLPKRQALHHPFSFSFFALVLFDGLNYRPELTLLRVPFGSGGHSSGKFSLHFAIAP
ncbi:hypothetical protein ACTXT7_003476 [Hymenolepis weldensis]